MAPRRAATKGRERGPGKYRTMVELQHASNLDHGLFYYDEGNHFLAHTHPLGGVNKTGAA